MANKKAEVPAEETAIAVADPTSLVVQNPAEVAVIDFAADAGAGLENFGAGDLAIPFITILQKNSPQADETNGKFIEGAKQGMVYNTVTGEIFDGRTAGIIVIPTGYMKKFVEWVPRDNGGGFVGQYFPGAPEVLACRPNDKGKLMTASGNQMIETAYHYVVVVVNGTPQWAVISMTSSQLKKSRKWNTLLSGAVMTVNGKTIKPPMFASQFLLKTVVETKDQNTWFGWDIAPAGFVSDANVYNSAKSYYKAVSEGSVTAAAPPSDTESSISDADEGPF